MEIIPPHLDLLQQLHWAFYVLMERIFRLVEADNFACRFFSCSMNIFNQGEVIHTSINTSKPRNFKLFGILRFNPIIL